MKRLGFIIGLIAVLLLTLLAGRVLGSGLTFSVNQTDFYFNVGETAVVPVYINNTFDSNIHGQLTYSMKQFVQQGGSRVQSQQTKSETFILQHDQEVFQVGVGSSNAPATVTLDLQYDYYNENNSAYTATLNGINVHFVGNSSQKQNKGSKKKSTSKKQKSSEQQSRQKSMQQKVQNNQVKQDSQNLKKQMQKQTSAKSEQKKEFEKELNKNKKLQDMKKKLKDKGYKLKNKNIRPGEGNKSGEFNYEYEKGKEKASLKGDMEDGDLKNLQLNDTQRRKDLMDKLSENKDYQEMKNKLEKQGFKKKSTSVKNNVEKNKIKSKVKENYVNKKNETATITAEFENKSLQDLSMKSENSRSSWWYLLLLLLIPFALLILRKNNSKTKSVEENNVFDYIEKVKEMAEESKRLFEQGYVKEAYALAGQAIRFYYIYKLNLNREITNMELIRELQRQRHGYKNVSNMLDSVSLVEFARFSGDSKDFEKIHNFINKLV